jgi:hypothetical protein
MDETSKLKKINNPHLKGNTKLAQNVPDAGREKIEKVKY